MRDGRGSVAKPPRYRPLAVIDAHAHLTDPRFASDLDGVIARARDAGVQRILTCGEDLASSRAASEVARGHHSIRVAVGIHPHRAQSCDEEAIATLRRLASDEHVVALGEIGLDLSGRSAPRADQERALAAQLELAAELDLPVILHVRESGSDVRALIDRAQRARGLVHCFSEGRIEVDEWIARGFYVSFAGTVTFARNSALREAARAVPEDRLLLETDAPYLAPEPHRGRRNEPAFIAASYARVAVERGIGVDTLVSVTARNAAVLFGTRW